MGNFGEKDELRNRGEVHLHRNTQTGKWGGKMAFPTQRTAYSAFTLVSPIPVERIASFGPKPGSLQASGRLSAPQRVPAQSNRSRG
jgi:hypothetical protein